MSVQSHNFNARYTYDISVVVPVYNRQDFIPTLVKSLDRQTARKKQFEVIFINDGSTDESLRRLNDAIQTHENYVLINQENKGVSAARNAGMRVARGRYIMFLDPDDTISRTTIKNIVAAFDSFGDTTDVVTYPILYHHLDTGRINRHKRWNWLNKTGVYSLQEFPHIVQTTMYVCIRNKGKDAIYFPEDLAFHEDEYFIAQNLIEKATIGFCVDATYHYYRHDTGAVALKNYALFSFNDIMQFFEMCLNVACSYERMRDYMYALVVYNVWVRYSSNLLFPDFGDEQTKAKNYNRLHDALKTVPLHA
ncbi:MAG: glycosyltransferase family 2 protein, partial [Eggerthellaceae bacterium]|nr:glycosyltransferase family 2 protein [Eggerthellaceae bacterium]